jgi:DNA-binding MarR family transcriptional regulator
MDSKAHNNIDEIYDSLETELIERIERLQYEYHRDEGKKKEFVDSLKELIRILVKRDDYHGLIEIAQGSYEGIYNIPEEIRKEAAYLASDMVASTGRCDILVQHIFINSGYPKENRDKKYYLSICLENVALKGNHIHLVKYLEDPNINRYLGQQTQIARERLLPIAIMGDIIKSLEDGDFIRLTRIASGVYNYIPQSLRELARKSIELAASRKLELLKEKIKSDPDMKETFYSLLSLLFNPYTSQYFKQRFLEEIISGPSEVKSKIKDFLKELQNIVEKYRERCLEYNMVESCLEHIARELYPKYVGLPTLSYLNSSYTYTTKDELSRVLDEVESLIKNSEGL